MTDPTPTIDLQQLAVFHGELNPQLAHVYLRLASVTGDNAGGQYQLRGNIRGPINHLTRTLPAISSFRDLGPGADMLARAIVPDPCFWAPGLPYLYDIHIELLLDNQVVANETRCFGMRKLGVHEEHLYLESHPWQLTGARDTSVEAAEWSAWREAELVRRLHVPGDQQCAQASRDGVMLIADLDDDVVADTEDFEREMARLSRHAAVAIVVVSEQTMVSPPRRVPNLLVAQRCSAVAQVVPSDWADLIVCESDDFQSIEARLKDCHLPVLIQQVGGSPVVAQEAAERCRHWAAKLEPIKCVAGYLV